jgi:hypothetical protein
MKGVRRIVGALALALAMAGSAAAERFSFVAVGDTAYNPPADYPVYERLIARINRASPAFTIHLGDTWGAMVCTEANHRMIRGWFDRYDHPVLYTPGDNEWTDCRKPEILEAYIAALRGSASPDQLKLLGEARSLDNAMAGTSFADTLASLAAIRKVFFGEPRSLGARTMAVVRQADVSEHRHMVENLRWEHGGVVFATIHAPGSGMNFTINDPVRANEAIARNKADVDWVRATFAEARAKDAKAVVISLHAGMFEDARGNEQFGKALRGGAEGPYFWIALAIRDLAEAFGKPVLLINGDFHELVIDRPFLVSQGEQKPPRFANITRLQVYGAPEMKAVRVTVDTDTPWVFGFEPLHD